MNELFGNENRTFCKMDVDIQIILINLCPTFPYNYFGQSSRVAQLVADS